MKKPAALVQKFLSSGHLVTDSDNEKLKKSTLLLMAFPFAVAGLIWGMLYFFNGLYLSGYIPFCYGILSLLSILHFSVFKKFKVFRFLQIFLILLLPLFLQISLGGFIPSSGVVLWSIISPLGALAFYDVRQSLRWFVAYILIVGVAFLLNDYAAEKFKWDISEKFINALFMMNIIGVSVLIYIIQYYFVGKQFELKQIIAEKNKEITDSLNYAKRIQQSQMASEKYIEENLKRLQKK